METPMQPIPEKDTAVVVQLAKQYKAAPFNMSPHAAYAAARHAVATLISPQAAGLALSEAAQAVVAEAQATPARMRLYALTRSGQPAKPGFPAGHPAIGTQRFRELLLAYRSCSGREYSKRLLRRLFEHLDGHTAELVARLRHQEEELAQLRAQVAGQPLPAIAPLVWKDYGTHGLYGTDGWAFAWLHNEEGNPTQFEVYEAPDGGHWRTILHVGRQERCIATTSERTLAIQAAQDHAHLLARTGADLTATSAAT